MFWQLSCLQLEQMYEQLNSGNDEEMIGFNLCKSSVSFSKFVNSALEHKIKSIVGVSM